MFGFLSLYFPHSLTLSLLLRVTIANILHYCANECNQTTKAIPCPKKKYFIKRIITLFGILQSSLPVHKKPWPDDSFCMIFLSIYLFFLTSYSCTHKVKVYIKYLIFVSLCCVSIWQKSFYIVATMLESVWHLWSSSQTFLYVQIMADHFFPDIFFFTKIKNPNPHRR